MPNVKHCLVFFPKASKSFVMRRNNKRDCKHAYFFSRKSTQLQEGVGEQQLTSW